LIFLKGFQGVQGVTLTHTMMLLTSDFLTLLK